MRSNLPKSSILKTPLGGSNSGITIVELSLIMGVIALLTYVIVFVVDHEELPIPIKLRNKDVAVSLMVKATSCFFHSNHYIPEFDLDNDGNSDAADLGPFSDILADLDLSTLPVYTEMHRGFTSLGHLEFTATYESIFPKAGASVLEHRTGCDMNSDGVVTSKDIQLAQSALFDARRYVNEGYPLPTEAEAVAHVTTSLGR